MNRVRLNDGSEYPVDFCGLSEGVVTFRTFNPIDVEAAAPVFSNKEATSKITYLFDNGMVPDQPIVAAVYEGYTRLIGILCDRWDGKCLIQLVKEV